MNGVADLKSSGDEPAAKRVRSSEEEQPASSEGEDGYATENGWTLDADGDLISPPSSLVDLTANQLNPRCRPQVELIFGRTCAPEKKAQVIKWLCDAFDALGSVNGAGAEMNNSEKRAMMGTRVPHVPLLGDLANLPPTPLLCTHTDGGGIENAILFFWDVDNSVKEKRMWWMNAVDEKEYIERCLVLQKEGCQITCTEF